MALNQKMGLLAGSLVAATAVWLSAATGWFDQPGGSENLQLKPSALSGGRPTADLNGLTAGSLASLLAFDESTTDSELNSKLYQVLRHNDFSGDLSYQLERRLGRPIDPALAELGQNLFFDKVLALGNDNSCSGCHDPQAAFADTQSISIGVSNNNIVGEGRQGPHNQRRAPTVINTAFYPSLMWNGRFSSASGDPFDNSAGYVFPSPEGIGKFPPNHPTIRHLLTAQAHMPPTEKPEMAGFGVIPKNFSFRSSRLGGRFAKLNGDVEVQFDFQPSPESVRSRNKDLMSGSAAEMLAGTQPSTASNPFGERRGPDPLPAPDADANQNEPIRQAVLVRLQSSWVFRNAFGKVFGEVRGGAPIDFTMVARALAEFQLSMTFADAPVDQFARGSYSAMTPAQKRGGLLFFGKGRCSTCHAVSGRSNQLFSDFAMHNIGVPQIAPQIGKGNVEFAGPGRNEDIGVAEITCGYDTACSDMYKFRSSPLRNLALQKSFMHNGAYTSLRDAISHHLDVRASVAKYDPVRAGLPPALSSRARMANMAPVLARLDPLLAKPIPFSSRETDELVEFVRLGLTDARVNRQQMCSKVPRFLLSGLKLPHFAGC